MLSLHSKCLTCLFFRGACSKSSTSEELHSAMDSAELKSLKHRRRKKGKSMKGLKACLFLPFSSQLPRWRTAPGGCGHHCHQPGHKGNAEAAVSSSAGATRRLASRPSSQHGAQWALFGHWLSPQLLQLLSGEHVCSHKEFNKLTTNKVAWK